MARLPSPLQPGSRGPALRLPGLLLALLGAALPLAAQPDSLPPAETDGLDQQQQLIEDVIANSGDDSDEFAFNDAFGLLESYRRRPLDLNRATADELGNLLLLTEPQIDQLLDYRDRMGRLISIYELQVVPGLDPETIRSLRPFVRVGGSGLDDTKLPLGRLLTEGDRTLFLRAQRRLERARGYRLGPDQATNYYLGNPWRYYARFRQQYGNRLSLGVTMEKDPGEAFFRENNRRRGFDYYSAHFFLRRVNRRIRALALGDFNVSFGQGLILYTGFGFGKSSQTTNVARGGQTLRPYGSVNEFNFMRGAGLTLGLGKTLETTLFASRRGRNGNRIGTVVTLDTIDQEVFAGEVSSLNVSGFHRTPAEVADRNALRQTSFGGNLRWQPHRRLRLSANLLADRFDQDLRRRPEPYNRFFWSGRELYNASLDYRFRLRNLTFFGEVAASDNGGTAQLHGLQAVLDRYLDLAVAYRRYDRDYQALNARPFGETNGGRNEEGLYLGLQLRPANHWRIGAYYDVWRHPWLRFNVDAPSGGHEYRLRITYWQKRKLETYLELRSETKGVGLRNRSASPNLDPVVAQTRFQARLHFAYRITPALEWRSRLDAGFTDNELEARQRGLVLYQDLHYRPRGPWSLSARFAVNDTDGYDVRFYEYENGLLYNARVLPYYGRGTRSFLVARYKGIRDVTLEARAAQSYFADRETIGSGLEETESRVRTEVGTQLIWRF